MAETGRFRRTDRLLDPRDFRRVLRRGRRRAHPDLVVVSCRRGSRASGIDEKASKDGRLAPERGADSRRLGITASRKVGNAVRRNRFKRRVREWFRRRRRELDPGLDVVVIARKSGAALGMEELDERLSRLLGLTPASGAGDDPGRAVREPDGSGSTDR